MEFIIGVIVFIVAVYFILHFGLSLLNLLWIVLLVLAIVALYRYIRNRGL